jgi:hypothetical protein
MILLVGSGRGGVTASLDQILGDSIHIPSSPTSVSLKSDSNSQLSTPSQAFKPPHPFRRCCEYRQQNGDPGEQHRGGSSDGLLQELRVFNSITLLTPDADGP